ncbi:alpha/beta hydrolase [Paenibacillus sp. 1001270B_150601_E10]|uniref:alpha/beta hydrolase n=1 Tax=Paenibacillus sp. 1001270B_150601_E10 TaxID=2787079 RepID=UPI001E5686EC|nr:alpha/beta fold hydrolase [Paenibacillus sp. 1001270B_150601_E10]
MERKDKDWKDAVLRRIFIILICVGILFVTLLIGFKKYGLYVVSNRINAIILSKEGNELKQRLLPKAETGFATPEEGKDYQIFNDGQKWFEEQIAQGNVVNWSQSTTETYYLGEGTSAKEINHSITLNAYYLKNKQETNKTVIIAHGFGLSGDKYGAWGKMYYDLGYNVLLPDARAHGKSEGNFISFGLQEKKDYTNEHGWIQQVIERIGPDAEIYLHGGSMGAATMMMAAGEPLPSNVKLLIEDCGYADLNIPFHHLKNSILTKLEGQGGAFKFKRNLAGVNLNVPINEKDIDYLFDRFLHVFNERYELSEKDRDVLTSVSAVNAMSTTTLPVLFIHGQSDTLVPFKETTEMLILSKQSNRNNARYEEYFPAQANHGASIKVDYETYKHTIQQFITHNT